MEDNDIFVDAILPPRSRALNDPGSLEKCDVSPVLNRKKRLTKSSGSNSSQKTMYDYFKATRNAGDSANRNSASKKEIPSPSTKSPIEIENAILSPSIKRNIKRFKSLSPPKPVRKRLAFVAESKSEESPPEKKPKTLEVVMAEKKPVLTENSSKPVPKETPLGFMIREVTKTQSAIQTVAKNWESPITVPEAMMIEDFMKLPRDAQVLFVKRFFGKNCLNRVKGDEENVSALEKAGLVDTNVSEEPLTYLLSLLDKAELNMVAVKFGVVTRGRMEIIKAEILKNCRTQRSAFNTLGSPSRNREGLLRTEVLKILGSLYKITDSARQIMHRIVLLFSTTHYFDEESKRAPNQRFFVSRIQTRELKFATFQITPIALFAKRDDFLEYDAALSLKKRMELAVDGKNQNDGVLIAELAQISLERLLKDDGYLSRYLKLASFLRRFSAGSVLVSVLTKYCQNMKLKQNRKMTENILWDLLAQGYFGVGYRGNWYEMLVQVFLQEKQNQKVIPLFAMAEGDPTLSDVYKLTLQLKAQSLAKRKVFKGLNFSSTVQNLEPDFVEILGEALPGARGSRLTYIIKNNGETTFLSVEDLAIHNYKSRGFTKGLHVEGSIVSTLFAILFYDVIYSNVPGVFLSPFQDRPLDFYSSSFYASREEMINKRLDELGSWEPDDLAAIIANAFNQHYKTYSVINWSESITAEMLTEIAICIGLSGLKAICERFIHQPRSARSGFPDLTLWNPQTKVCRFVEVKSPKDTLATNQRVWLSYLKSNGIECEVCEVKN